MRSTLLGVLLALGCAVSAVPAHAGGVRLYVQHSVSDYATFRKTYDDFDATRRKMGVTAQAVYRSQDDPNNVTITHDFKTAEAARALMASPDLHAAMAKAGVTGAPQVWFAAQDGGRTGEARGVRAFVRHEVADYAAWRKAYDDFDAARRKLGVTAQAVYRSLDNPNDVTVTHDFKTLDAARAFAASPELKSTMEKAGVTGAPQVWFTTRAAK